LIIFVYLTTKFVYCCLLSVYFQHSCTQRSQFFSIVLFNYNRKVMTTKWVYFATCTFFNMFKPYTWRCDIHKAVTSCLEHYQTVVWVRDRPLTTCPMSINNISLRLKAIPQYCYYDINFLTCQDDVQRDIRTLLLQLIHHFIQLSERGIVFQV